MSRLQNALTKQLTDEHERVDLGLREKVSAYKLKMFIGRRSKEDQEKERRDRSVTVRSSALVS